MVLYVYWLFGYIYLKSVCLEVERSKKMLVDSFIFRLYLVLKRREDIIYFILCI